MRRIEAIERAKNLVIEAVEEAATNVLAGQSWPLEPPEKVGRRAALVALEVAWSVGVDPDTFVFQARRAGATWREIGETLGVTRQAAQDRFRR
jgi:hypothetical protein